MKRLVCVMLLSGLPVACGTQAPSAPDVATFNADDNGSVSSLALRARPGPAPAPSCVKGDRSQIQSFALVVVDQGPGFTTLRAVARGSAADTFPPLCLEPSMWQVTPNARIDWFTNPEQAIFYGQNGKYEAKASILLRPNGRRLWASTKFAIE